ncbi:MAG: CheR family methyltransferase, partial [Candidatus Rokuibacteriota bacterium]
MMDVVSATRAAEELTPADLARLSRLVAERSGLAFPESRWPFLRNRARDGMARRGFASARRWLADLEASAAKRGTLYCEVEEALHAHETGFFRFPPHHRVLAEVVLPSLVRVGGPRVRILEVGCATGENAYSIAMTVRESVPRAAPSAVEVLAVDWSRAALVTGVRGVYARAR